MRIVQFAIIGLGMIGKRHKQHISDNPYANLVAVCDIRSREEIELEPEIPLYTTISKLLSAHPEVEVVSITTPNGLHANMAIEVLQSGRYPIIEKPIALTVNDAQRILDTAKQTGYQFFPVMQNRYSPPSAWLKEIISSGRLGNINMVIVNCFWNRDSRYYKPNHWHGSLDMDGGVLFTQFSHYVDILLWLLNKRVEITHVTMDNLTHEGITPFADSGVINFRCDRTIGVFNFSTSVWNRNLESSVTIIGSKGSVKIGGQYMDTVLECHIDNYQMPELSPCNTPNDYGEYKGSAANHCYVIENVVNSINNVDRPHISPEEALRTIEFICEAMRIANS
ncbi:MAG: Gfo/Idh/MocA family oxidoreductase [Bacteroidia bacterium]|nr:Gfo/Idh/MocA family oxidoreductase [Bacteroidia bacterium]